MGAGQVAVVTIIIWVQLLVLDSSDSNLGIDKSIIDLVVRLYYDLGVPKFFICRRRKSRLANYEILVGKFGNI